MIIARSPELSFKMMGQTSGWHRPWLPRGRRTSLGLDQHLEKHWPGGVKIKMTLGLAKTRGKRLRWQMVKPRLGLAGGVLFKANCQGVPITPNHVRNAKSRNITPI